MKKIVETDKIRDEIEIKDIEAELTDKLNSLTINHKDSNLVIDFDEDKISEAQINKYISSITKEAKEKEENKPEPVDSKPNKTTELIAESNNKLDTSQKVGWIFLIAILAGVIIFFGLKIGGLDAISLSGAAIVGSDVDSGNAVVNNGEVQTVKMYVEGGRYILEPSTLNVGVPVRIEADMSRMPGCSKSIVISAFNVRKSLSSSNNIIEFTPSKAGTFNIACSMNMYRGAFTVV